MTQHIVKSFQEELDSLSAQIAQMGGLTEAQLSAAIEAVTRRDQQLAERTILEDQRIDALESEIEAHAVRMIALRQPMATDLREAIAAIKISIDLERIGELYDAISTDRADLALHCWDTALANEVLSSGATEA